MARKLIILIGGAPTTGKSTLAKNLSKHLGLPWISTDQIRTLMQSIIPYEQLPSLHNPKGFDTAEKFLNKFTASEIVDMEMAQGDAVWPGVKTFVERDFTWRDGFIIEGVNILPRHTQQPFKQELDVRPLFIVDTDEARVRDVVYTRGLWDDADTYADDLKPKEVEWAILYGQRLRQMAIDANQPWLDIQKDATDMSKALAALGIS